MRAQPVVNRVVLALIGVVLLGGGSLALAGGLDLYRRWNLPRPTRWLPTGPRDALGFRARHSGFTTWPWAWPVTLTALTLVVLLGLVWLLRQLPSSGPRRALVGGPAATGPVWVRGTAVTQVIRDQTLAVPGVQHARVHLTGPSTHPRLHLTVALIPTACPREVLAALQSGPIHHAQLSTGWTHLPVEIRLSIASHRARRTR